MKQWYALHVKPHKEKMVQNRLQNEGVAVYCPMLRTTTSSQRTARSKPLFPGYLFVHTNLESFGMNAFRWMHGAIGLVAFGDCPAPIPQHVITEMRRRVTHINAAGGLTLVELKAGDRVRIVEGPFTGYEAIFDTRLSGRDRVQVFLAFLSRHPQPLKLDTSAIVKVKQQAR